MAYWMRAADIQIGPYRYSLNSMAFSFECPFEDSDEPPTATVTVTNMSEQTRHSIRRNHVVIINAGYEGDTGCIFKGKVAAMESKHSGTEWTTTITALGLREEWLFKQINKTYEKNSTSDDIIRDLCNIYGAEVARCEPKTSKTYPRGLRLEGRLQDSLKRIVMSDCQSRLLIRNERIYITDPTSPVNMGFLLSPQTGLLLSNEDEIDPYIIDEKTEGFSNEAKEATAETKNRTCLLNHQLGAGDIVMVQSRSLNGRFMVVRGTHRGSYDKDWVTELEMKSV
ncbi:hypothetical protein AGMMS49992_28650 [Clostridia bacterium]|nr:hypothetical protein AGMMS49992_28650 [Clostridia bacterium]